MAGGLIPLADPDLGGNEVKYVMNCLRTGWISSKGEYVKRFEDGFASFCGVKHGVGCGNGTLALHLALVALGIKPGDEVIVPTITYVASGNAVVYCGAKPVFVDCDKRTWNIDANKIEEKITKKTKAIMPVHIYGHPCDMDPIKEIAKKHKLWIVEDAAEAHGAEYKGKKVGGIGDVGCFSFYGNKILTTGEGGMCVTNNKNLAQRMSFLKDSAMDYSKRYWHPEVGYNYRMTNVQAAIGLAQLERTERFIKIKRENAKIYNSFLKNVPGVTLPVEEDYAKNVYWMYSIIVDKPYALTRDELMAQLTKNNIDSRPFFYPMHTMPSHKTKQKLPVSEYLSKHGINLPSSVKLKRGDIKRICDVIIQNAK